MCKVEKCELCGSDDYLNFHHLIPRTLHSNKKFTKLYDKMFMRTHGIWICKDACHRQIHRFISEKEMGLIYNTKELLISHEEVKNILTGGKKEYELKRTFKKYK